MKKKIDKKHKDREIKEAIMKAQSIIDGNINKNYFVVVHGRLMTKPQALAYLKQEIKELQEFIKKLSNKKKYAKQNKNVGG